MIPETYKPEQPLISANAQKALSKIQDANFPTYTSGQIKFTEGELNKVIESLTERIKLLRRYRSGIELFHDSPEVQKAISVKLRRVLATFYEESDKIESAIKRRIEQAPEDTSDV